MARTIAETIAATDDRAEEDGPVAALGQRVDVVVEVEARDATGGPGT